MKKYENYLLMSDLDGTLIRTDKTISAKNKEAIEKFVALGGQFGVATGRTVQNVAPYLEGLNINVPCILYNGGGIYDMKAHSFLQCHFLMKEALKPIVEKLINECDTVCVQIFTTETTYIVNTNRRVDPVMIREKHTYEFAQLATLMDKEWTKIILNDTHENLLCYEQQLYSLVKKNVIHTVFSVDTYLEILPFGVSKGNALKELIQFIGAQKKRVIAIGDYDNDIEMLKEATVGIAPANASDRVKSIADKITVSNDEDAIFEVITHVLPKI